MSKPRIAVWFIIAQASVIVLLLWLTRLDGERTAAQQEACRNESDSTKTAFTAALLAAKFLAESDDLADYATREEPSIRVCVWVVQGFENSPEIKRVGRCLPNEAEVVFPITYNNWPHRAKLGKPTVTHVPLDSDSLIIAM